MWKRALILISITLAFKGHAYIFATNQGEEWNKTRAIKELPFCALILRNYFDEDNRRREIFLIVEPNQVTENNLVLLFKKLADDYPRPLSLQVFVYTDVRQLAMLATGQGSSATDEATSNFQWAYYKRSKEVELFRYNPNHPEPGMKTIILRGKE